MKTVQIPKLAAIGMMAVAFTFGFSAHGRKPLASLPAADTLRASEIAASTGFSNEFVASRLAVLAALPMPKGNAPEGAGAKFAEDSPKQTAEARKEDVKPEAIDIAPVPKAAARKEDLDSPAGNTSEVDALYGQLGNYASLTDAQRSALGQQILANGNIALLEKYTEIKVEYGTAPARNFGAELGNIADRLNAADSSAIAGIANDLANLEKDANGSLNAAVLAAVKIGLGEKKAEFGSNGTHIPNAAAGDSTVDVTVTDAPKGVKAEFDNDAGQERMQPGRDFGAELVNIADRLNAADSAAIAGIEKDLATLEKDDVNGSMNATILAVVKRGLADIKGQFNAVPAPKLPADSGTISQLPENKGQQTQAENDTATASTAIVKVANTSAAVVNLNAAATAADANTAKGTILTREEIIDSAQYYVNELNAISQDGATSEQKCALWENINAFAVAVNASLSTNEDATLRSLLGVLKRANNDLKNTINE